MINFSQYPKTLCIFRLSAIGDVSHSLPIIHTLKKVWQQTEITDEVVDSLKDKALLSDYF
jgi:heptosyltransferase I